MSESFTARIISNRRVTIPLVICHLLSLKEGDIVKITIKKGLRADEGEKDTGPGGG